MQRLQSALGVVVLLAFASVAPASARQIHIVAYGDSMTAGWLVARKDAYPAQLQAALRKKGYNVAVDNAGINGGTFADALLHFDEAFAPGTDIAIIEFGTNDLRAALPAISCPTTVIVGDEDYAAPPAMAEALHAGIRNSRYVLIEKARHLTPLEVPDRITDELKRLIASAIA